jgi:hypothetical protein
MLQQAQANLPLSLTALISANLLANMPLCKNQ